MVSKSERTKHHFQNGFLSAIVLTIMLCICLCQSTLPLSYESTSSTNSIATSSPGWVTSMTLKVSSLSPPEGSVLTNFPTNLEVKVTRGGFPVQGARVQFWMMGGSHDAEMHNAILTMTDSSGIAHLTLLNQNTLEPSTYVWYADATKLGFKGGASNIISFIIPFAGAKGVSMSGGTVSTDKNVYSLVSGNGANIVIHGNVNMYHLGDPIILKIKSPSGKTVQLVEYGTYLGAFQSVYTLGPNSKLGTYTVTVYYDSMSSTSKFDLIP